MTIKANFFEGIFSFSPVLLPALQTLLVLKVIDEVLEVVEQRSHPENLSCVVL